MTTAYDLWLQTTPEDEEDERNARPHKQPRQLPELRSMVVNGVRRYEEDYINDPLRDWD